MLGGSPAVGGHGSKLDIKVGKGRCQVFVETSDDLIAAQFGMQMDAPQQLFDRSPKLGVASGGRRIVSSISQTYVLLVIDGENCNDTRLCERKRNEVVFPAQKNGK